MSRQKLAEIKKIAGDESEWHDQDRAKIEELERDLSAIEMSEDFLNFPNTKVIISTISDIIKGIESVQCLNDVLKVEHLPMLNDLVSRKKCYQQILQLFTFNVESAKEELENKFNDVI